jgi:hypothetical protein
MVSSTWFVDGTTLGYRSTIDKSTVKYVAYHFSALFPTLQTSTFAYIFCRSKNAEDMTAGLRHYYEHCLKEYVRSDHQLCIITDSDGAELLALHQVFPWAELVRCAWHRITRNVPTAFQKFTGDDVVPSDVFDGVNGLLWACTYCVPTPTGRTLFKNRGTELLKMLGASDDTATTVIDQSLCSCMHYFFHSLLLRGCALYY